MPTPTKINDKGQYDGKFTMFFFDPFPANHPIFQSGNAIFIARVRSGVFINGDKPDSTWPNYTYNNYFYSETNAISVGKRLADWFEYQGLTRDKAHVTINGVGHAGAFYMHNWARPSYYVGKDPQGNDPPELYTSEVADQVSDVLTAADFDGFTRATEIAAVRTNYKYPVGFIANALAKAQTNTVMADPSGATHNIMGLSNWVVRVLQSMKSECDTRNLCYPQYLMFDHEGWQGWPFWKMSGYSSKPSGPTASSASPGEFSKQETYRSSVWRAIQADSRYSTETVYREWTGNGWVNKTFQDAWNAAGGPTGASSSAYNLDNNIWFARRMMPFSQKMNDYALHKFLYEPAKTVFPGMICGNSDSLFATTASTPFWEGQNSWLKYPAVDFEDKRHLHADFSSPHLFSPNIINQFYRYAPEKYNPNYYTQENNALYQPGGALQALIGHPFGTTSAPSTTADANVYRSFNKQRLRSLVKNNPLTAIGWLEAVGEMAGGEIPGWRVHRVTVDDLYDIMTDAYSVGIRNFKMFNPFMRTQSQQKIDDTYRVFTQFKSFVDSQTASPLSVITEDGSGGQTATSINSPFVPRVRYVGPAVGEINQTPDKDSVSAPVSE